MTTAAPALLPVSADAHRITTVTIEPNQGPMVILDLPLIQRLEATFNHVRSLNPAGIILASGSPRVFIAGADLKSIDAMSHTELENYLRYGQEVFGLLCAMPCPTVAAINGAALGGGLEIAMHCDGLVGAPPAPGKEGQPKPYPVGLPEAGLNICPGWGGTNLLPARMDAKDAIERTAAGKPMTSEEAAAAKLFDAVAPAPNKLLDTAAAWLKAHHNEAGKRRDGAPSRWIGRPEFRNTVAGAYAAAVDNFPTDPGKACLKAVAAGLESGWQAALKVEREELNRLRASPTGKASITAFLNKTK